MFAEDAGRDQARGGFGGDGGVVDERAGRVGVGDDFGDGGGLEGGLDGGDGLVEAFVEGAEVDTVGFKAERAGGDAFDGVDDLDDVPDGDLVGGFGEGGTAVEAALRGEEVGLGEVAEDFGEIAGRDAGGRGDLGDGGGLAVEAGEVDDDAEGVFGGLGDQARECSVGVGFGREMEPRPLRRQRSSPIG